MIAALVCLAGCRSGGDTEGPAPGEPCGPAAIAEIETESTAEATVAEAEGESEGEGAADDPLAAAGEIDADGLPGFPHTIAFDPDEPSRAWFTMERGLLVTGDGGATWEQMQSSKIETGRAIVALRPPGGDLFVAGPGVLRRSADDGASWTDVPAPSPGSSEGDGSAESPAGPDIRGMAVDPTNRRTLLALLGDGRVSTSTDEGDAAWTIAGEHAPAGAYGLWPVAAAPTVLWTTSLNDRSICESRDGGASWARVEPDGLAGQLQGVALADDGVAYAATIAGLFRSDDRGETWEQRGPFRAVIGATTLWDRSDTVLVIVFGGHIFRSEDGGLTWGSDEGG